MSIAHRWNVPKRQRKEIRRSHLPSCGRARCIQHNGHGFEVGKIYDFHTEIRDDFSGLPPYDVVKVLPQPDYSKDFPTVTWVFINSHGEDLFREYFEIL